MKKSNYAVIDMLGTMIYVAKGDGVIRQFTPNYKGEDSFILYDCLTPLGRETYMELFKSESDLKYKVHQLLFEDSEFQENQLVHLRRSILASKKNK